jgi:uncharacterized protein (DUF849 family)
MNGIFLAEEVRKLDPEVAVLMTTGYNEELVMEGPERAIGRASLEPARDDP